MHSVEQALKQARCRNSAIGRLICCAVRIGREEFHPAQAAFVAHSTGITEKKISVAADLYIDMLKNKKALTTG